jgi:NTE family protein
MAGIATTSMGATMSLEHLLPADDWRALQDSMAQEEFTPGEHLVHQGSLEPPFYIIREGVASVVAQGPNGDLRELGRIGAGECIGEMSLLTGDPASADVVALTPVSVYSASQAKLASLDDLRSRVIEALSAILAARLKQANERLLTLSSATSHVITCDGGGLDALRGLPAAIADVVDGRVLVLLIGAHAATAMEGGERVDVRAVGADEAADLSRILHRAAHDYAEILIFSNEPALPYMTVDPTKMLFVAHERDLRRLPPEVPVTARIAVIGDESWTQPGLRRLADQCGRQVVAVTPASGSSDGGDLVARLARTLTGRQVGLALGSGAAKGLAHLGVLRALTEIKVPIDIVSGCSIGAAIAAGVAARMDLDELTELTTKAAGRAIRPTLPLRSFLSNAGVRDELKRLAEERRIEDLDLPLAVVATDLFRRSEVTFTTGLIWPRLVASMAIPGAYPPSAALGSYLVDGGVLNPVPVQQCRDLGAGVVIGVRLTATRTSPRERLDFKPKMPLAVETIMRTFEIMLNRISEVSHEHADVNVEVCVDGGGGVRDFKRAEEIAELGYRATMAAAASLTSAMPYVKAAS